MFKLPNKFYKTGGGGSSGTTTPTSNKKYEITITQPPEHEPRPDFIRGIPYAAKDNMMFCKCRKMTLDDYKEIKPEAVSVPENIYILQDINGNDLIITSDMIEDMVQMQTHLCANEAGIVMNSVIRIGLYISKQYINGKFIGGISYNMPRSDTVANIVVKVSDVDNWFIDEM